MYHENILPFAKANLEKLRGQVPVVPLAPGHGVRRIIGGPDLKRACFVRSVHIDRYGTATIRGVEEIGRVGSRLRDIYRDIEPLAGFGPADIEHVSRRNNLVEGIVVNRGWLAVKLRVRSIYSLMDTKLIEVGPIRRIQLPAAVVLCIGVVIRDSFATQVVVGAQHPTRYFLWTAIIAVVVISHTSILPQK